MGRKTIIAIVGFIIFVVFVVLFLIINATKNPKSPNKPPTKPTQVFQTIPGIVTDPLVYDELDVSFEGNVSDWVTKRVFTVAQQSNSLLGSNGAAIIVISNSNFSLPKDSTSTVLGLGDTSKVLVKGRVTIMDRKQLSQAIGYDLDGNDIKLDDNSLVLNWTRGTVILLDSVTKE